MQLPEDFIKQTSLDLGEEWQCFQEALSQVSPTSIRLNTSKYTNQLDTEKVLWCNSAYYLDKRPAFTFDPMLHQGLYYVQEASSMFLAQAIEQLIGKKDIIALDLCAAPGGKTTLLLDKLSKNSFLISNEYIKNRSYILSENVMKWGDPNNIVTSNAPSDFSRISGVFDCIVIDAPCSGEGMFRKDEQAITEWSLANVEKCQQRQKEIISSVWDALKEDGYIFYSTCTYNKKENEDIVEWIFQEYEAELIPLAIDDKWKITSSSIGNAEVYHFYPHKTKGEGFFFAAIQKKERSKSFKFNSVVKKNKKQDVKLQTQECQDLLLAADEYSFSTKEDQVYALASSFNGLLSACLNILNVISYGICMGTYKGKQFIPHQGLALSQLLDISKFTTVDVSWETALSYLRCENIFLENVDKGFVLLTYKNKPLGFIKHLGNRANNLYPQAWRIRSPHNPDKMIEII